MTTGQKLTLTGLAGVCVSLYGVYMEHQKKTHGDAYEALCDTEHFSCSKARDSEVALEPMELAAPRIDSRLPL